MKNIYSSDEYISKNPSMHAEDSQWKINNIYLLLDTFMNLHLHDISEELVVLDVGGGAGLIMKGVSEYLQQKYDIRIRKICLDLSPGMLDVQLKYNPDAILLNEDICSTSLGNKSVDLALMMDVLEHIPSPENALSELSRISRYMVSNTPLERNLSFNMLDIASRGRLRMYLIKQYGHINCFNFSSLIKLIENYGIVIDYSFCNVFKHQLESNVFENEAPVNRRLRKIGSIMAKDLGNICPRISAEIFGDSVSMLIMFK